MHQRLNPTSLRYQSRTAFMASYVADIGNPVDA
jgi:hypothetical protein